MQSQIAVMNKDGKVYLVFRVPCQQIEMDVATALMTANGLIFQALNAMKSSKPLIEVPRIVPPSDIKKDS